MEEKNTNQVEKKTFSYQIGQAIACMTAACVVALMIALTVKVIVWMF